MKYITLIVLLLFLSADSIFSQNVTITPVSNHAGNNQSTFPTNGNTFLISGDQITLGSATVLNPAAWSYSANKEKFAFLERRGNLSLLSVDENGNTLIDTELDFFDQNDETLQVYQYDDGRVVLRDNVANFTFFDSKGKLVYSVSNFSQSADGERESKLAKDKNGRTVVLYNPVIAYGTQTGSQARIVYGDQENEMFFNDRERELKYLQVSNDGAYITLIATNGNDDRVLIFDRFGNEIFSLDTDNGLQGAVLGKGAEYLTTFSSGRIQVIEVPSGEILASASSRGSLLYAAYQPEDETIIAFAGSFSNRTISNPALTAVDVSGRQIVHEEISETVSAVDPNDIRVEREGANRYRITGLNMYLDVSVQF